MEGVEGKQVELSRSIQKQTGRTFYFATLFLPKRVRNRTHILYAFFRICDEVVDDYNDEGDSEEKYRELDALREQALGYEETDEAVVEAFSKVREEFGIPDKEVEVFVDAMQADLEVSRYEDFEELRGYMRGSAAAVGNMMTCIMGVEDYETTKPHAEALGEAFQMTNFLRDVREDAQKKRTRLPAARNSPKTRRDGGRSAILRKFRRLPRRRPGRGTAYRRTLQRRRRRNKTTT